MYTSPGQAPHSFGEASRQPFIGPMTDQDPASITYQYGKSHQHDKSHQHGNSHQHDKSYQHGNSHQRGRSHHWMCLLICAPMLLVVAGYLQVGCANLVAGDVLAAFVLAINCMPMTWLTMRMMDHGSQHRPPPAIHRQHHLEEQPMNHPAATATHDYTTRYTYPMHPKVTSNHPGRCLKCGMFL